MAARYLTTLGDASQIPSLLQGKFLHGRPEARVAMVGRSNVGKSSLINSLIGGRLAQVSKEPGKTRAIHFYVWTDKAKIIADLPGYGFAKTSKAERDRWAVFINRYLTSDEGLERAAVLLDSRHGPTELDEEAIRFLSAESVPILFVFTKIDALRTQADRARRRKEASARLRELGYDPELAHWVSSKTGMGLKRLAADLAGSAPPTAHEEAGR